MKILVIGGTDLIGSAVVKILRTHGHREVAAVPGNGINVITGEGLVEAMQDTQVVLDLSSPPLAEGQAAIDFFSTAGRNLLVAAINARVKHYVALSIIGVDQMLGVDYMYAKKIQEDFIRMAGIPYTIIRSTRLPGISVETIEHIQGIISTLDFQPIAVKDVARFVAMFAVNEPLNGITEIAGPERRSIYDFVQDNMDATLAEQNIDPSENKHYFHVMVPEMALVP